MPNKRTPGGCGCCDPTSKCETACTNWEYTSFELSDFSSSHLWGVKDSLPPYNYNLNGNTPSGTSNGIPYGGMPVTSRFDLSSFNGTYVISSGEMTTSDWKIYTGNHSSSDELATSRIPCYGLYKSTTSTTPIDYSVFFPEYIRPYISYGGIGANNSALAFVGSTSTAQSPVIENALGPPVYFSYDVSFTIMRGFLDGGSFAFFLSSNNINSVSEFVLMSIAGSATVPDSQFCIGGATFYNRGSALKVYSLQNKFNCCPETPHNIYKQYLIFDANSVVYYMLQPWKMNLTRNSNIGKQNKPASGIFGYTCSPYVRTTSSGGRRVTSSNDPRIVG